VEVARVFHARFRTPRDWWFLERHLRAVSWVNTVVIVVDRPERGTLERIFDVFQGLPRPHSQLITVVHRPSRDVPDRIDGEVACEEGKMRQLAWDVAARAKPDWILTGDLDEWPTADFRDWLHTRADADIDVYYLKWLNVLSEVGASAVNGRPCPPGFYRVVGDCIYSLEHPGVNCKGAVCRRREGVEYRYDVDRFRHVRVEPNPVSTIRAVEDDTHVLIPGPPYLFHWHWYDWAAWLRSPLRREKKYQEFWASARATEIPRGLL
jgi:hypothetical protein